MNILRRIRCALSASHLTESRMVVCKHGDTHFIVRCIRCGKEWERDW